MRKLMKNYFIFLSLLIFTSLSVMAQTDAQITTFTKAVKFNDISEVKSLLKQGVNPNAVDPNGNPMLLLAIKEGSNGVAEILLADKRIDVDLSNNQGETPLMIASIQGDLPMVKILVKQKNAMVDHIGWTPLHYACTKGQFEVAQYLVANGAIIDSRSLNGTTPLMMAIQSGNEELVKFLLDKGADLQAKNNLSISAIDIAEIYDKPWIADGLKARWLKLYKKPYVSTAKPRTLPS